MPAGEVDAGGISDWRAAIGAAAMKSAPATYVAFALPESAAKASAKKK